MARQASPGWIAQDGFTMARACELGSRASVVFGADAWDCRGGRRGTCRAGPGEQLGVPECRRCHIQNDGP
eukprot:661963-Pyramimonas_sp.AAC.1